MTSIKTFAWTLLIQSVLFSPVGFAAPFTNGSFENLSGVQLQPNQQLGLQHGDSRLVGWAIGGTGTAATVICGTDPKFGLDFPPIDRANQLNFNGGSAVGGTWISQTFDTVVGADYVVSFYVGHQGNAPGNTNASLSLTARVLPTYGPLLAQFVATPPPHGYGKKQSFSFTATSSTTTLQLEDTSLPSPALGSADLNLDAVAVLQVGQPQNNVQFEPSTDDLWDVSRGTIVTGQSEMNHCADPNGGPFDARDVFGGNFSPPCYIESQDAIFADGKPDGFVHFIEWATPNPVTVRSFNLWTVGGYPPDSQEREFASFRLLAKSSNSSTFDVVLYTFTPSHPYSFVQDIYGLLVSTDIKPTTARQFRAEFVNRVMPGHGNAGPRVVELDGFGDFVGPSASIRSSEREISWDSVSSLSYQVEFREDLPVSNWTALGSPVVSAGDTMKVTDTIVAGAVRRFYRVHARAPIGRTTDDLWDVSRGTVITGNSQVYSTCPGGPFDARDIFGGHFSLCQYEAFDTIFVDNMPEGFVHFVEWATPNPVTIRSFNLWATGSEDNATDPTQREMARFRLLAKSPGSSTYDLSLYTFTPSLPYKWVDNVGGLLISSDIRPVTAREFRAEFINHAVKSGQSGPRVIELDGFGEFIGPPASIRTSAAEVSWDSAPGLQYKVEYRDDFPGSNWTALASPVVGDGKTMRITDKIAAGAVRRFYRVRATE